MANGNSPLDILRKGGDQDPPAAIEADAPAMESSDQLDLIDVSQPESYGIDATYGKSFHGVEVDSAKSNVSNWWNSLYNAIDEIHVSKWKGRKLEFDKQIDELDEQKEQIINDQSIPEEQRLVAVQKIEEQKAAIFNDKEYERQERKIDKFEGKLEGREVDKLYEARQQQLLAEQTMNPIDYLMYELPVDLGGSMSEMRTQLASAFGPQAARKFATRLASKAAVSTLTGPAAPFVMAGLTAAEIGVSLYALYKMRDSESEAEKYGAFEEKINEEMENFARENGRFPDESEQRKMRMAAYEGLEAVKQRNMNLMAGDAFETLMLATPWTRGLNTFKTLTKTGRAFSNTSRILGGAVTAISEGAEEADQYDITRMYVEGKLKDDESLINSVAGTITTRGKSLYTILPGVQSEYEDDPEYWNAIRSGMILGGLMGGGASTVGGVKNLFSKGMSVEEAQMLAGTALAAEESSSKAMVALGQFKKNPDALFSSLDKLIEMGGSEAITVEDAQAAKENLSDAYKRYVAIQKTLEPSIMESDVKEAVGDELFNQYFTAKLSKDLISQNAQQTQQNLSEVYNKMGNDVSDINAVRAKNTAQAASEQIREIDKLTKEQGETSTTNDFRKRLIKIRDESQAIVDEAKKASPAGEMFELDSEFNDQAVELHKNELSQAEEIRKKDQVFKHFKSRSKIGAHARNVAKKNIIPAKEIVKAEELKQKKKERENDPSQDKDQITEELEQKGFENVEAEELANIKAAPKIDPRDEIDASQFEATPESVGNMTNNPADMVPQGENIQDILADIPNDPTIPSEAKISDFTGEFDIAEELGKDVKPKKVASESLLNAVESFNDQAASKRDSKVRNQLLHALNQTDSPAYVNDNGEIVYGIYPDQLDTESYRQDRTEAFNTIDSLNEMEESQRINEFNRLKDKLKNQARNIGMDIKSADNGTLYLQENPSYIENIIANDDKVKQARISEAEKPIESQQKESDIVDTVQGDTPGTDGEFEAATFSDVNPEVLDKNPDQHVTSEDKEQQDHPIADSPNANVLAPAYQGDVMTEAEAREYGRSVKDQITKGKTGLKAHAKRVLRSLEYSVANQIKDENGNISVYVEKVDPDGNPIPYKSESPIDTETLNSPNVKVGDELVVIKRDTTVSDRKGNTGPLIEVYRAQDVNMGAEVSVRQGALPIGNIPVGDNIRTSGARSMRDAMENSSKPYMLSEVTEKGGYDLKYKVVDGEYLPQNVSTLSNDWVQNKDGSWEYKQTPHRPIFGLVTAKPGENYSTIPNDIDIFDNIPASQRAQLESDIASFEETFQKFSEEDPAHKGKPFVLRRAPDGSFKAVHVFTRVLNQQESNGMLETLKNPSPVGQTQRYAYHGVLGAGNYGQVIAEMESNPSKGFFKNNNGIVFPVEVNGHKFYAEVLYSDINEVNNVKEFIDGTKDNVFVRRLLNVDGTINQGGKNTLPSGVLRDGLYNAVSQMRVNMNEANMNANKPFIGLDGVTYDNFFDYLTKTDAASHINDVGSNTFTNTNISIAPKTVASEQSEKKGIEAEPVSKNATQIVSHKEKTDASNVKVEKAPEPAERKQAVEPSKSKRLEKIREQRRQRVIEKDKKLKERFNKNKKHRLYTEPGFNVISPAEMGWLKSKFGDKYLSVIKDVDHIVSEHGAKAFGWYNDAMISIAQLGEKGSGYHEAFHFAMDMMLNPIEKRQIMREGRRNYPGMSDFQVEERLAEEFRDYMLAGGIKAPQTKRAKSFFERILNYILKGLGFRSDLESMFKDISSPTFTMRDRVAMGWNNLFSKFAKGENMRYRQIKEFQTDQQYKDAIEGAAHIIISSESNEFNLDINQEGVLEKVRNEFLNIRDEAIAGIESLPEDVDEMTDQQVAEYEVLLKKLEIADIVSEHWENGHYNEDNRWISGPEPKTNNLIQGMKNNILREMKRYGYGEVVVTTVEVEDQMQNAEEQIEGDGKERLHDLESSLRSPKDNMTARIRRELSQVKKLIKDKNGNWVEDISDIGFPRIVEFDRVYTEMLTRLADTPPGNIEARLEQVAQSNEEFYSIYDAINKMKGSTEYNGVLSMFLNDRHNFITVVNEKTFEDGKPKQNVKVLYTDRKSIERSIKDKWSSQAEGTRLISSELNENQTGRKVNTEYAKQLQDNLEELKIPFEINQNEYNSIQKGSVRLLKQLGITFPDAYWDNLSPKSGKEKSAVLRKLLKGDSHSVKRLIEAAVEGKDPYHAQLTSTFDSMARMISDYMNVESNSGTFIGDDGKMHNAINTPSFLSSFFTNLKDDEARNNTYQQYAGDNFYKGNAFVNKILRNEKFAENVEMTVLNAYKPKGIGNDEVKSMMDNGIVDTLAVRMANFSQNLAGKSKIPSVSISVGALADKKKQAFVKLPMLSREDVLQVFADTIRQEASRIEKAHLMEGRIGEESTIYDDVDNYVKHGKEFNYINMTPDQQQKLIDDIVNMGYVHAMRANSGLVNEIAEANISSLIEKSTSDFVDMGIIEPVDQGYKITDTFPKGILKGTDPTQFIEQFVTNDVAWRMEMSKVLMGDMAFYKNADDYYKRMYQLVTPGNRFINKSIVPEAKLPSRLKRAVFNNRFKTNDNEVLLSMAKAVDPAVEMKDVRAAQRKSDEGRAAYKEHIEKLAKKNGRNFADAVRISQSFRENAVTDGASFTSIDIYRLMADAVGMWTADHEYFYNIAWNKGYPLRKALADQKRAGRINDEQAKYYSKVADSIQITPIKPFHFGMRQVNMSQREGEYLTMLPEQFKDSIIPIMPEWGSTHEGFRQMLELMEPKKGVDEQGNESTIDILSEHGAEKVGAFGKRDLFDDERGDGKLITRDLDVNDMRMLFMAEGKTEKSRSGSQKDRLLGSNITSDQSYQIKGYEKSMNGLELRNEHESLKADRVKISHDEIKQKLNLTEDGSIPDFDSPQNWETFLTNLRDMLLEQNINRDLSQNFDDALRLIEGDLKNLEFAVPLGFPTLAVRYQSVINSMFRNEIMTQKEYGGAMVNCPDMGIDTFERDTSLKFIQPTENQTVAAETNMYHPNARNAKVGRTFKSQLPGKEDQPTVDAYDNIIYENLTEAQKDAMRVIVYRIPTQSKASMMHAQIRKLLPEEQRNTVQLPSEGTTQAGFDFDVDKSFMIFPPIVKEDSKPRSKIEDKLFNISWGILSSPYSYKEMVNPVSSDLHHDQAAKYEQIQQEHGVQILNEVDKTHMLSPSYDAFMEMMGKSGKAMIGVHATYSTAHSVMQHMNQIARQKGEEYIGEHGHAGIKVKAPVRIEYKGTDGVKYSEFDELGKIHDADGNYISDNHSVNQNSSVDAQKDPIFSKLNISMFNAGTLAYMVDLGVPMHVALDFLNQPILRELSKASIRAGTNSLWKASQAVNPENLPSKKLQEMVKNVQSEDVEISESITYDKMQEDLSKPLSEADLDHQAAVLSEFFKYHKAGQDMISLNQLLSPQTLTKTPSVNSYRGFLASSKGLLVDNPDSSFKVNPDLFGIDNLTMQAEPSKAEIPSIASYIKYGVNSPMNFQEGINYTAGSYFTSVHDRLRSITGNKQLGAIDSTVLDRIDRITNFALLNSNNVLYDQLIREKQENNPSYVNEMFFKGEQDNTMTNRLSKLFKEFPGLQNNAFLSAMEPNPYNHRNDVKTINFSMRLAGESATKNDLIEGFSEILDGNIEALDKYVPGITNEQVEQIQNFADDLVVYGIYSSGFQTRPNSFIDVVPNSYWENSGLIKNIRSMSNALTLGHSADIAANDMAEYIVRSMVNEKGVVQTADINMKYSKQDKSFIASSNETTSNPVVYKNHVKSFTLNDKAMKRRSNPDFLKLMDFRSKPSRYRLYMRTSGNTFNEVSPLGDQSRIYEMYNGAQQESILPQNKEIISERSKIAEQRAPIEQGLQATDPVDRDMTKSIADKLSKRFNIPYQIVSEPTADWKGRVENGIVYLNEAIMSKDTVFHEFAHPFINAVQQDNKALYDSLKGQLIEEHLDVIKDVADRYPDLSVEDQMTEAMVEVIGKYASRRMGENGQMDSTRMGRFLRNILKALSDVIKRLTRKNRSYPFAEMDPNMSLLSLSDLIAESKYDLSKYAVLEDVAYQKIDTSGTVEDTYNQLKAYANEVSKRKKGPYSFTDSKGRKVGLSPSKISKQVFPDIQADIEEANRKTAESNVGITYQDATADQVKQLDQEVKKIEARQESGMHEGTNIHQVFESVFNDTAVKEEIPKVFLPAYERAVQMKKEIESKGGKIFSEFNVIYEDENPDKSVGGFADVLIINKDGSVSIKDFKTFQNNLTEQKEEGFSLQTALYSRMLESELNLRTRDITIEPVRIKLDENNNLTDIEIQKPRDARGFKDYDKYYQIARGYVPNKSQARPENVKQEYRGKLIFAERGTGKSYIRNDKVIDSEKLYPQLFKKMSLKYDPKPGGEAEAFQEAYDKMPAERKKRTVRMLNDLISEELQKGNTVLTSNTLLSDNASVFMMYGKNSGTSVMSSRSKISPQKAAEIRQGYPENLKTRASREFLTGDVITMDNKFLANEILLDPTEVEANIEVEKKKVSDFKKSMSSKLRSRIRGLQQRYNLKDEKLEDVKKKEMKVSRELSSKIRNMDTMEFISAMGSHIYNEVKTADDFIRNVNFEKEETSASLDDIHYYRQRMEQYNDINNIIRSTEEVSKQMTFSTQEERQAMEASINTLKEAASELRNVNEKIRDKSYDAAVALIKNATTSPEIEAMTDIELRDNLEHMFSDSSDIDNLFGGLKQSKDIINKTVGLLVEQASSKASDRMYSYMKGDAEKGGMLSSFSKYRGKFSSFLGKANKKEFYKPVLEETEGGYYFVGEYKPEYFEARKKMEQDIENAEWDERRGIYEKFEKEYTQGKDSQGNYIPKDSMKNDRYSEIMSKDENDPVRRLYEDMIIPYIQAREEIVPDDPYRIPSMESSPLERASRDGGFNFLDFLKTWTKRFLDNFRKVGSDTHNYQMDENGAIKRDVPMRFVHDYIGKNDISLELGTTVSAFMNEYYSNSEKAKVLPEVLSLQRIAQERNLVNEQSSGNVKLTDAQATNSYKALTSFIEGELYGEHIKSGKLEEGKFDIRKAGLSFMKFVRQRNLWLNMPASFVQATTQSFFVLQEGIAGQHYGLKDWAKSQKEFWINSAHAVAEYNKTDKKNKISAINDFFNILDEDFQDIKPDQINPVRRLASSDTLWSTYKVGDVMTKTVMAMAMLNRSGTMEKLNFNNGKVTIKPGADITPEQLNQERMRIKNAVTSISDITRSSDHGSAARTFMGKLTLMHRNWLAPGVRRRFGAYKWDETRADYTYGYIRQFLSKTVPKAIKDIRSLNFSNSYQVGDINPMDGKEFTDSSLALFKANNRRAIAEATMITALSLAMSFAFDEDDDDDLLKANLHYVMLRTRMEMFAYVNPDEAFSLLKSPVPASGMLEDMTRLVSYTLFRKDEEIERGRYQGYSHKRKYFEKMIPVWSQIQSMPHIKERIASFN